MPKWDLIYELTDIDEEEMFLSEVPVDLLKESLSSQFEYPLEYKKYDYIKSFIEKYEFSKDNMLEDDIEILELSRDEFITYIEKLFENYLNIGFNDFDNYSTDEQHEIIHYTYRFFIKNIKKNFVSIVKNYISNNLDEIDSKFSLKNDLTTNNLKNEIDNMIDVKIIGNLREIIDHIFLHLRELDNVDDFFDLCEKDEVSLDLDAVREYYNKTIITGNFIDKYLDMVDSIFIGEIQSKVRNYILKKYPYREGKRKNSIDEIIFDDLDD